MKKVKKLFVLCALAFMLCGCLKANVNIEVKSDGTADMTMEVLVSEAMLSYMDYSVDDLKESMSAEFSDDTKEATKFKDITRTYDDEKYVGFEMTYDSKAFNQTDFSDVIKINDDDTITFIMEAEDIEGMTNDELSNYDDSIEGLEFNFNITMPGKILENNVGEIKGNTVTVNLLNFDDSKIEITSKKNDSNFTMIIIVIVAVIVIAGGVFFFMKQKKNNNDDGNSDALRPIDPNAPVASDTTLETQEASPVESVEEVVGESETNPEANEEKEIEAVNQDEKEVVDNETTKESD